MDKGLEVIVTKAQVSQDGQKLELQNDDGKAIDVPVDEKLESLLEDKFHSTEDYDQKDDDDDELEDSDEPLTFTLKFNDFEDVIQLSHYLSSVDEMDQHLYHFEDRYYLYIQFTDENMSDDEQENVLSQLLEYGHESSLTIHRLEEYGKTIFQERALESVKEYFPVD
jgi:adapter protein MecA 1/2